MKVFEDLIEELKGENLLEETVIETRRPLAAQTPAPTPPAPTVSLPDEAPSVLAAAGLVLNSEEGEAAGMEVSAGAPHVEAEVDPVVFYRKRAMEEVSCLQMVEHVLSGVEREHMKMTPQVFDDLELKKTLHRYLQAAEAESDEKKDAELAFLKATEEWFSALAARDSNISVANIRRFCENSKPVLSSQALIALGRFYRNSPFSEPVRGKFDFVISRLFSKELEGGRRKLLFGPFDMVGHLKNLYANWESLTLFDENEKGRIGEAVDRFSGFSAEADAAKAFDDLVASDFFNRVRLFKEGLGEMFYSAEVTAAAISCNVAIGNRFVDLIREEKERSSVDVLAEKYGYNFDTLLSAAASKTLLVSEIIDERSAERPGAAPEEEAAPAPLKIEWERAPVVEPSKLSGISINKWLVLATVLVVLLSAGIYFWSENAASAEADVENADTVSFNSSELKNYLRDGRSSNETLYAIAEPSWDVLSEDDKKAKLQMAYDFATAIKMKRVNILNRKGRTIGYAAAGRTELLEP